MKQDVMKQRTLTVFATMLAFMLVATAAFAQNPHFVRGPVATDQGTTLNVTGSIAGLGGADGDAIVTVVAQGTAIFDCENPGGNIAPGQRKDVTLEGSDVVTPSRSGRVNFDVTTSEPSLANADCPNPKWTPILQDVEFTSYTVTVTQRGTTYNLGTFFL
jgi:hypothetical protein